MIQQEHKKYQFFFFSPGLGKWRHSGTGKYIKFPTKPLDKAVNNLIGIHKIKVNYIPSQLNKNMIPNIFVKKSWNPTKLY